MKINSNYVIFGQIQNPPSQIREPLIDRGLRVTIY